jgi:ribonuclease P protein component
LPGEEARGGKSLRYKEMGTGESRLKKTKEFRAVFSAKESFRLQYLVLRVGRFDKEVSRFGIVVSKKVSKKAVVRNRIRRLINEAVRLDKEHIRGGVDGVFVVLPGFEVDGLTEAQQYVRALLRKARVFQ